MTALLEHINDVYLSTVYLVGNEYVNYRGEQNVWCTRSFSLLFEACTRSTLWLVQCQGFSHACMDVMEVCLPPLRRFYYLFLYLFRCRSYPLSMHESWLAFILISKIQHHLIFNYTMKAREINPTRILFRIATSMPIDTNLTTIPSSAPIKDAYPVEYLWSATLVAS